MLPILTTILKDDRCLTTEYSSVQSPNAIIVGPTRELVVQIANEAKKFANGKEIFVADRIADYHETMLVRVLPEARLESVS